VRDGYRSRSAASKSAATLHSESLAGFLYHRSGRHQPGSCSWILPCFRMWWCLVSVRPNPFDKVFSCKVLLASGSPSCGISKSITQVTLARKNLLRPSVPCFSARIMSPCFISPMGRDNAFPGSYVSWFKGSCRRRAVYGPKQAAPISDSGSWGCFSGGMTMCWIGRSGR